MLVALLTLNHKIVAGANFCERKQAESLRAAPPPGKQPKASRQSKSKIQCIRGIFSERNAELDDAEQACLDWLMPQFVLTDASINTLASMLINGLDLHVVSLMGGMPLDMMQLGEKYASLSSLTRPTVSGDDDTVEGGDDANDTNDNDDDDDDDEDEGDDDDGDGATTSFPIALRSVGLNVLMTALHTRVDPTFTPIKSAALESQPVPICEIDRSRFGGAKGTQTRAEAAVGWLAAIEARETLLKGGSDAPTGDDAKSLTQLQDLLHHNHNGAKFDEAVAFADGLKGTCLRQFKFAVCKTTPGSFMANGVPRNALCRDLVDDFFGHTQFLSNAAVANLMTRIAGAQRPQPSAPSDAMDTEDESAAAAAMDTSHDEPVEDSSGAGSAPADADADADAPIDVMADIDDTHDAAVKVSYPLCVVGEVRRTAGVTRSTARAKTLLTPGELAAVQGSGSFDCPAHFLPTGAAWQQYRKALVTGMYVGVNTCVRNAAAAAAVFKAHYMVTRAPTAFFVACKTDNVSVYKALTSSSADNVLRRETHGLGAVESDFFTKVEEITRALEGAVDGGPSELAQADAEVLLEGAPGGADVESTSSSFTSSSSSSSARKRKGAAAAVELPGSPGGAGAKAAPCPKAVPKAEPFGAPGTRAFVYSVLLRLKRLVRQETGPALRVKAPASGVAARTAAQQAEDVRLTHVAAAIASFRALASLAPVMKLKVRTAKLSWPWALLLARIVRPTFSYSNNFCPRLDTALLRQLGHFQEQLGGKFAINVEENLLARARLARILFGSQISNVLLGYRDLAEARTRPKKGTAGFETLFGFMVEYPGFVAKYKRYEDSVVGAGVEAMGPLLLVVPGHPSVDLTNTRFCEWGDKIYDHCVDPATNTLNVEVSHNLCDLVLRKLGINPFRGCLVKESSLNRLLEDSDNVCPEEFREKHVKLVQLINFLLFKYVVDPGKVALFTTVNTAEAQRRWAAENAANAEVERQRAAMPVQTTPEARRAAFSRQKTGGLGRPKPFLPLNHTRWQNSKLVRRFVVSGRLFSDAAQLQLASNQRSCDGNFGPEVVVAAGEGM